MLPLNDNRWSQLTTFFGEPDDVPILLERWRGAIGTLEEEIIYRRDLFDTFLHQNTITNIAFAIAPWLVEANRLKFGVYYNHDGTEEFPAWLMSDYQQAIMIAQSFVDDVLEGESDLIRKKRLMAVKPALFGNAELAWSQWC